MRLPILIAFCALSLSAQAVAQDVWVRPYYRTDGTFVQGHYRTSPNFTVQDNFSYKGNYNPYTGQIGTNYYRHSLTSAYYTGPSLYYYSCRSR